MNNEDSNGVSPSARTKLDEEILDEIKKTSLKTAEGWRYSRNLPLEQLLLLGEGGDQIPFL